MKVVASSLYQRTASRVVRFSLAAVIAVSSLGAVVPSLLNATANAAPNTVYTSEDFTSLGLSPDRTAPASDSITADSLTEDVVGADASSTPFYKTEGLQATITGSNSIKATLDVDPAWAGKSIEAGLWGVTHSTKAADGSAWPILQYYSDGTVSQFRMYDTMITGDWTVIANNVSTGDHTLEIAFNPTTSNYDFYVDGADLGSETAVDSGTGGSGDVFDTFGGVIFDNYNFGDDYNVTWSNFNEGVADDSTIYVSPNGNDSYDGTTPSKAVKTIQQGVNLVKTNGTVVVAAGTYADGATINKSITLKGAQADVSPNYSTRTHGSAAESLLPGATSYSPTFAVTADDVTIDGFDFGPATDGTSAGPIGVDLGSTSGAIVKDSIFEHNQRGISLEGAKDVTISDDVISNNNADPENNAGIWGDGVDGITIANSTLDGASNTAINLATSSKNITINADSFANDGNTAVIWQDQGVTFSNNYGRGFSGSGLYITDSSNVNVTNNDLSLGSGNGISISDQAGASSDVTITGNTLDGFVNAINLGAVDGISDTLNVHMNKLGDNSGAGVNAPSNATVLVDASNNWWGSATGPNDTVSTDGSTPATNSGTGSTVNGAVNYAPWAVDDNFNETSDVFPGVSITSPADGAYVNGTVDVTGTITDADPSVAYLTATNNATNQTTTLLNDNTGITNVSENWDTTKVADGVYTIHLEAKNLAGNDAAKNIIITVDNTFPKPSLNLTDGQIVGATVTITGTDVEANPSVNYITVKNDTTGVTQTLLNDNTAIQNPTVYWDTTGLADGNYTVYYEVKDKAGNDANTSVDVTLDNTAPVINGVTFSDPNQSTSPLVNTSIIGGSAVFTVSQTELHPEKTYVEYDKLVNNVWQKQTGSWFYTTNTDVLNVNTQNEGSDGTYQIKVSSWDVLNHETGYSQSFIVDNTAPQVSLQAPSVATGVVTIKGFDTELHPGVNYITVSNNTTNVSQTLLNDNTAIQNPTVSWDTSSLQDGSYTIYYEAKDQAGNDSHTSRQIIVDHTAPVPSLNLTTGQFIRGTITINGTDTEANPSVNYITVTNDSTQATQTLMNDNTGIQNPSVEWSTSGLSDGNYTVYYEAKDLAGNDASTSVDVTVDNTVPSTPLLIAPTPVGDAFENSGSFLLDWSDSTDATSGVSYYEYQAANDNTVDSNGELTNVIYKTIDNQGPLTESQVQASGTPDGVYYWQVRAIDKAGNASAWSAVGKVTVDTVAPIVTINAATLEGATPTITGTIDDSTAVITITIDGVDATATNNGDGTWSYTVPTALTAGPHTVSVTAKDQAGNVTDPAATGSIVVATPVTPAVTNGTNTANTTPAVTGTTTTVTPTNTNTGVLGDATTTPSSTSNNDSGVKGASTTNKVASVATNKIGLAWLWWLIVAAIVVGIIWWIAAASRRRSNDT